MFCFPARSHGCITNVSCQIFIQNLMDIHVFLPRSYRIIRYHNLFSRILYARLSDSDHMVSMSLDPIKKYVVNLPLMPDHIGKHELISGPVDL